MSREVAYSALFTLLQSLQTNGAFKTCSRRVKLIDDMNNAELPALFMGTSDQHIEQRMGSPAKRTYTAQVFLYVANPNKHTAAGIQLNGLIDAVEAALAPSVMARVQTLGGVVAHAWLDGKQEVYELPQSERAAAILNISLLVP